MKDKSGNQSSSEAAANGAAASAFATPDDLVGFASTYFASDFPNPERLECPPGDALVGFARSGNLPDEKLRAHLFGCSECFKEYQEALAASRAETNEVVALTESDSWWKKILAGISLRPIPVFAGAFSLVLLVFGGAYVWRTYRTAPEQTVASSARVLAPSEHPSNLPENPRASPSRLGPVEQITPQLSPRQTNQQRAPGRRPVERTSTEGELIAMSIDLGNYAATRGEAGSGGEVKLSPARTHLLLTLPEGSARGFYTVSVVGASGNARVVNRAHSADGKTVATMLDMQGLTPQKYTLRISREGEPPIDIPIVVTAEKTVSPFKRP